MKYVMKCPKCKRRHTLSTHKAVKYCKEGHTEYSWDCPHCGEEIIAKTFWRRR